MPSVNAATYAPPITAGPPTSAPRRELGQEEFLKLLMVQLANQDPLSPMDTDKFMDQITSMNSLQQQMETNDLLNEVVFSLGALNNEGAVNLVGREVVAVGDTFAHTPGETEELSFSLGAAAESTTVKIFDDAGKLVGTIERGEQPAGESKVSWDGRDLAGNPLPAGDYTFKVEATDADGEPIPVTTFVRGVVDELRFDGGAPILVVDGQEIALAAISRVLGGASAAPSAASALASAQLQQALTQLSALTGS